MVGLCRSGADLRCRCAVESRVSRSNSHSVCNLFACVQYSVNNSVRPPHLKLNGRRVRADRLSQTIFVLEDDADISRLVQHHLEAAGFQARLFHTPTHLIPDAERQAPALFLLDICLLYTSQAACKRIAWVEGS